MAFNNLQGFQPNKCPLSRKKELVELVYLERHRFEKSGAFLF
jgi:hypothetical protein